MHAMTLISFSSLAFSFVFIFKSIEIQRQKRFVKIPLRVDEEYPRGSYKR